MLKLTDAELESNAERPRKACPSGFRDDLIAEVRSFRREIRDGLTSCESVKDVLALLLSSRMLSSLPELGAACVLFCTLAVTVAEAERSFFKLKLFVPAFLRLFLRLLPSLQFALSSFYADCPHKRII